MKINKLFTAVLAGCIALASTTIAYAESTPENMESDFILTAAQWNAAESHDNRYQTEEPIDLEDELFEKAYPYMWYGDGSDNRWNSYMTFNLDIPEHAENDAIYVSFYYKSASEFDGADGNHYTCPESVTMNHIRDSKERIYNLQSAGLGDFKFTSDDNWHRVEALVPAFGQLGTSGRTDSRFEDGKLFVYFNYLSKPMYILISEIRVGIYRNPEGSASDWNRFYTEIGWHLQRLGIERFAVNGYPVSFIPGIYEYTVPSDEDEMNFEILGGGSAKIESIGKSENGKYEIIAAAAAYDKSVGEDGNITYRRRINKSTGEFSPTGSIETYSVKNADLRRSIIVNLDVKSAESVVLVNGEETNSLSGCVGGNVCADICCRKISVAGINRQ